MGNDFASENDIADVIDNTFLNLKNILNSNIAVGAPMNVGDNGYVIPISKINVGCFTGGAKVNSKCKNKYNDIPFSGGNGTGFSINPVGLVCVINGNVSYISCNQETSLNQDIINVISKSLSKVLDKDKEV